MEDIFVTQLQIRKVRHLKNINIPLSGNERKHLILTGKNGSGKTSVLEEIKKFLTGIENKESGQKILIKCLLEKTNIVYPNITVKFNSDITLEKIYSAGRFVFSWFEAARIADLEIPDGIAKTEIKKQYRLEERPGNQFVQYLVNLKADQSFARDDNDTEAVLGIAEWFENFENSLKEIFEDEALRLKFDRKNYNFNIIQENREKFDFHTLSDGYSAIISIVSDLILRMEKNRKKNYDVQGIVLIDEIETHLHIELQKKILPFLTNFFPKIQFIVTTHSPFVLTSADNAVVYDLEKELLINDDLSGYSYDGIIESYFDADKYSDSVKNRIREYEQLVLRGNLSDEEDERMLELRRYLKSIPPFLSKELSAKFHQIELARIGKKNG
ncbi:AAA family ATPase [Desulfococcaceae bacterium HSG8]|nr:AAA family ATPase [Desulfococcaceae bacterium HSG8]